LNFELFEPGTSNLNLEPGSLPSPQISDSDPHPMSVTSDIMRLISELDARHIRISPPRIRLTSGAHPARHPARLALSGTAPGKNAANGPKKTKKKTKNTAK
jgi:hypothetical protein